MTITCFIRYEIDPFQKDQFEANADHWARIIPRLVEHLLGYFVPHEGSNYEARGWGGREERSFLQVVPASDLQAPTDTWRGTPPAWPTAAWIGPSDATTWPASCLRSTAYESNRPPAPAEPA